MEHHIHNGLYPTNKTLKTNRKYLLDEVRKLVTKKSKVTTLEIPAKQSDTPTTYIKHNKI